MRRPLDALQGRELGAFIQVLARVHIGDADARTERRADRLLGDNRVGAGDLRLRDIALGASALDFLLRRAAGPAQPLDAGEARLREGGLRLLPAEVRLLDGDVERHEHRARIHDAAGNQPDLADGAGQLGP